MDTKNFKVSEFACHCGCGFNIIDQRVINMAQTIRDALGVPVKVNSGCRCEKHNARMWSGCFSMKELIKILERLMAKKALRKRARLLYRMNHVLALDRR